MNSRYVYRVASCAATWGEWIACGPLLIYVIVSLDNKCSMSTMDWVMIGSFFLCLLAGFLINFPSSVAMGIFWLFVSCVAFLPSVFLPYYCHPSNSQCASISTIALDNQALLQFSSVQHTLIRRYQLAWILTIMQPLIAVTYLLAYGGLITPAQTIASYQTLSVLTKGYFISIAMVLSTPSYIHVC